MYSSTSKALDHYTSKISESTSVEGGVASNKTTNNNEEKVESIVYDSSNNVSNSDVTTTTHRSINTTKSEELMEQQEEEEILQQGRVIVRTNCNRKLYELLESVYPCVTSVELVHMIKSARNAKEIRQLLENVIYKHPLCFDLLNGHGFRVVVLQSLTNSAVRTECLFEWFDCTAKFRKLGFKLTRTFITEGFSTIRQWIVQQFNSYGRAPHIVTDGLAHLKELLQWCHEDDVILDHVIYTRLVYIITLIASYFDRQNLYRNTFPPDLCKRDGVVVEWVVNHERCLDFDECVLQCDAVMEEVLEYLRNDIPSRPSFSLSYRLIDYYFTTDNVEKMIAVMEDIHSYGISIAESSTAKLMQLACAMNYPQVPELFIR